MTGLGIVGVIFLAAAVIAAGTVLYIRYRVRRFSERMFDTPDIAEGIRNAQAEMNASVKSIPSLTRLLLPNIQKDFPSFNWAEYKDKLAEAVRSYIESELGGRDICMHETQIGDYRRQDGTCYIKTYTSAGYTDEASLLQEKRYVCNLLYVQDADKLPVTQTGIGLSCPNCGAPVKMLSVLLLQYSACKKQACEFVQSLHTV